MNTGMAIKRAFTGPGGLVRLGAAGLLLGTLASQHPSMAFNRVQRMDRFSALFPNWRFFAPTPAQHDYHFFYRTLSVDGETSKWLPVEVISGRKMHQIFWFPGRRPEKAVFDLCTEIITELDNGFDSVVRMPAYRILVSFLRQRIALDGVRDIKGFQFTLARATGYDPNHEPEIIFVSPYTPVSTERPAPAPAVSGRVTEASEHVKASA